ncbi:DUF5694 domain-containing protein [Asticcacaulis sp. DXS10W]|uniref:DUF5694 domain-containing protein n=1 Tax=Asticcacaulis currens TaxID=2984210 RepID=A0ABT5IDV4_9CAUL|nr:DUF5694 domain-containing protein [Asticcacaulis currens]MDC7694382.1 DUF5694 domain-containing protein [Asticcacaulis currens]
MLNGLAVYSPNIVATEVLTGEDCLRVKFYKLKYDGVSTDYCVRQEAIIKLTSLTTGLNVPDAEEEAERLLKSWPDLPTGSDRRHLAAVFGAAGDYGSALVQWARLPKAERVSDRFISDEMVAFLNRLLEDQNEVSQIAVPLAARLGLERLHPSDDHTADSILNSAPDELTSAIQSLWKQPDAYSAEYRRRIASLHSAQDLLSLYSFLNSTDGQEGVINGEWRGALRQRSDDLLGRQYVAWWETRNLRMAANIRASFGNHPGARVIMIVGASHKPYLERYISLMHDVVVTDVTSYLDKQSKFH